MNPLSIVILIIYVLLVGSICSSIVASHHRPIPVTGPGGKEGRIGDVGVTGQPGITGPTGVTGGFYASTPIYYGVTGATGATGIVSPDGSTGIMGTQGPSGPPTGQTGFPGARGPSPIMGTTGPTGGVGPTGSTGPTGFSALGPVFVDQHYTYNAVLTASSTTITIADPPMVLLSTIPTVVPPEFTLTPSAGTIQFNLANTSYIIQVGIEAVLNGLPSSPGGWAPAVITLNGFPGSSLLPPISLWFVASGSTPASASVSGGITIVYTTPLSPPAIFNPSLTISTTASSGTTISITLLSIMLQHASA